MISLPFEQDRLRRIELDTQSLDRLDVEDLGRLLGEDVVVERFSLLSQLSGRVPLTPIEEQLQLALREAGIEAVPQARFGPYRLDFLIERDTRQIGIEADGRDFHEADRDAERDADLLARGMEVVLRFTGSEIWRDAAACAARVVSCLEHPPRRPIADPATLLQALDPSQEAAVKHAVGPARVLAPAGAGKTRVMVNRIIYLVGRRVDPSQILALTFNKKANDALAEQVRELRIAVGAGKIAGEQGVVCATFNAFGYRYQRDELGIKERTEPSEAFWRRQMASAVADAGIEIRGSARGSDPLGQFLKALDRARADLANPDGFEVEIERHGTGGTEVIDFGPVWRTFEARRLATGVQAFDDQLFVAVSDLLQSPERRRDLQRRFLHVLVDEFQDLNATQLALVEIVSRPQRNLFVVGDDDQLIYGWRYAKLANILDFHDRLPVEPYSKTYVLSTNYRCSASIVAASRRVIDHNQEREPKDIRPRPNAPKGEVTYLASDDHGKRTEAMVKFLRERKEIVGEWRQLAVLCRYKAQQPLVAIALDAAGIPRTPLLAYRLFSDPQMQLVRAYLQLVVGPQDIDADQIGRLINRPNRYVKDSTVEWITGQPIPWEGFERAVASDKAPRGLTELNDRVVSVTEQMTAKGDSSEELLDRVVGAFDLLNFWHDHAANGHGDAKEDASPGALLDLLRLHAQKVPVVGDFLSHWDGKSEAELSQRDVASDDLERERTKTEDRVVIGTLHSSKGREYDSVVLYDYEVDLSRLNQAEVEEERRVFYVGLTRAQTALLATIASGRGPAHQFIRESIAPAASGEADATRQQVRRAREEQGTLEVDRQAILGALERIESGSELTQLRCDAEKAELEASEPKERVSVLTAELQSAGFFSRFMGRMNGKEKALAIATDKLAELLTKNEPLCQRIALLEADPGIPASMERDRLEPVEVDLRQKEDLIRDARLRLEELSLIAPHETPP